MYNGSHAKANNKPRIRMNKLAILFIAVVMLIGAVVGSTVCRKPARSGSDSHCKREWWSALLSPFW